ncbi:MULTISPECIES: DUF1059 domain-containing protein [Rhizobium]|uniref:DUF1059 domain-containing protein n=1 Tax=Rhizobium aouanii TaxID=3118145 RepID=A0ABU8CW74_9HYPH|nr:DUF1059 domain-containing protein [Rhizobium acaciae]MCW1414130.1 DUF1059 domain-containing protein [Rhizobium acaciae]MCW1746279.1 DUF1059 domain-containing protein [Rhizobium acaciae]MCW1754109.1 DUF1059 domain-containing protein [Rhizobium acaciae]
MKQFDCATLVPGVDQIIRAHTEANVVARAVDYLKTVLGEDGIRPTLVEEIRTRITDVPSADRSGRS